MSSPRPSRRLARLCRLVALLLLMGQATGLAHLAFELGEVAAGDHCGSCTDGEDGGKPCPPLCHACQGAHGVRVAVPHAPSPLPAMAQLDARKAFALASKPPEDPFPDGLFRPPRA